MMRKKRGIVCEKKKYYTIFLTNNGEFLPGTPLAGKAEIGDEVEFLQVSRPSLFVRKTKPVLLGSLMMAAVFLFFIVASLVPNTDKVMAYVQLDTDRALEFGVNQKGHVISLRQLNDASTEFWDSFDEWKGKPIRTVLENALKESSKQPSDVQIMITTIFPDSERNDKVHEIVDNAVSGVQKSHKELTLEIKESTSEDRLMADEQQMSVHEFIKSKQQVDIPVEKDALPETEQQKKINPVIQKKGQENKQHSEKLQKEQDIQEQSNKETDLDIPSSKSEKENEQPSNSKVTKAQNTKENNPKVDKAKNQDVPPKKKVPQPDPPEAKNKAKKTKPDLPPKGKGRENNPNNNKNP
ncbi:anti-sigma factor domain-containing protein [Lederbergia panacisoli]|uniref:anti-sigma factor domain-containing protein n=1 Tax=Lederbergia panacisoli TaxID=1255251 RepID=UPI00214AC6DA|nr:hypothetical protein [Lederbergia panacisoli]MCR2823070.1 hypothetical protein [Lederbergia panacisoli]